MVAQQRAEAVVGQAGQQRGLRAEPAEAHGGVGRAAAGQGPVAADAVGHQVDERLAANDDHDGFPLPRRRLMTPPSRRS
ncbi:hypothetical protein GCM10009634_48790 [Saccharothrix xinjiangensis]